MSVSELAAEAVDLCSPDSPPARAAKRLKVQRKGGPPRLRDMEMAAPDNIIDLSLDSPDSAGCIAQTTGRQLAAPQASTAPQQPTRLQPLWGEFSGSSDNQPTPGVSRWDSRRRHSAFYPPELTAPRPPAGETEGSSAMEVHDDETVMLGVDPTVFDSRERLASSSLRSALLSHQRQGQGQPAPQRRGASGVRRRQYAPPQQLQAPDYSVAAPGSPPRAAGNLATGQQAPKAVYGSPRARKAAADAAVARHVQEADSELAAAQEARSAAFRAQRERLQHARLHQEHERRVQQLAALDAAAASWSNAAEDDTDSLDEDEELFMPGSRFRRGNRSAGDAGRRSRFHTGPAGDGGSGRGSVLRREWGGGSLADAMLGMLAEHGSWGGLHLGGHGSMAPHFLPPGGRPDISNALGSMRAALSGMAAGSRLPPSMLFSDRDFDENDYEALLALDEGIENRRGASKEAIAAIPTVILPAAGAGQEEEPRCPICLEEYTAGATLRRLGCKHAFHQGCLDTWLQQKAACPICQAQAAGKP